MATNLATTLIIVNTLVSLISFAFFYKFVSEFKNLSMISPVGSEILKNIYKLFVIKIILSIIVLIIGVINYIRLVVIIQNFDFVNATFAELSALLSQISSIGSGSNIFSIFPPIFEVIGYFKFHTWIGMVTSKYSYQRYLKDPNKTTNLIFIGSICQYGSIFLVVIPFFGFQPLIVLAGFIVILIGFFQTAKTLEYGFDSSISPPVSYPAPITSFPLRPNYSSPPNNKAYIQPQPQQTPQVPRYYVPNHIYPNNSVQVDPNRKIVYSHKNPTNISPMSKFCPICGGDNFPDSKFCSKCGLHF